MDNLTLLQLDLVRFAMGGGSSSDLEFHNLMSDHTINILDAVLELQHIEHKLQSFLLSFPEQIGF